MGLALMWIIWQRVFTDRGNLISLALVALLSAVSLGLAYQALRDYHASNQIISDLLARAAEIRYYDDVLTTSVRLGALTGDATWERRYESAIPRLDQALQQAIELHPPGQVYLDEINTANQRLSHFERQAFVLASSGRLEEAADLLFGEVYEQEKANYADGLGRFTNALENSQQSMERRLQGVFALPLTLKVLLVLVILSILLYRFYRWEGRLQLEHTLGEIARRLVATDSKRTDEDIRWVLGQVAALGEADHAALILYKTGESLGIDRIWSPSPHTGAWPWVSAHWLGEERPDDILDLPVIHHHSGVEARVKDALQGAGIGALLAVNLLIAGGARLQLVLGSRSRLAWRRAEAPLLLSLLEILSRAIASQANEEQLFKQAMTDPLTGLFNRRYFMETLEQELKHVRRFNKHTALLVVDIDHFKAVNDTYGHDAGDAVLQHFARLAKTSLREIDLIGRLGGEEFGIILPATDPVMAMGAAERLRRTIAASETLNRQARINVTISTGLTMLFAADHSIDEPMHRADMALYAAKSQGRNLTRQLLPSPITSG
jgi:diguanylate cyclase (GGDEF)-like protein